MSLLLNDIQLPLLVKAALVDHNTLSWNNLDQFSSLWTAFLKCKSNIRDGFRLENLSWRLWYRQRNQSINISPVNPTPSLRRTRSLPNLSLCQSTPKKPSTLVPSQPIPPQRKKQKFFISTEPEPLIFKKHSRPLAKPVSLLTEQLNHSQKNSSGLRRCQSRYGRLDQYFLNATA